MTVNRRKCILPLDRNWPASSPTTPRKRVPQALLVDSAVAFFLSPDGADRLEAAFARRLDRMTKHLERLERHLAITKEALVLSFSFGSPVRQPRSPAPVPRRGRRGESGMRDLWRRSEGDWRAEAP